MAQGISGEQANSNFILVFSLICLLNFNAGDS